MQDFVIKKVPRTLMLCIRSKRLLSVCSVPVSCMAEALLISISIPPNVSMVCSPQQQFGLRT